MNEKMELAELLGCPFCGKQPHCGSSYARDDGEPNGFNFACPDGCSVTKDAPSYEQAILIWNTRISSTSDVQRGADILMIELDKLGMHITYSACRKIVEGLLSSTSSPAQEPVTTEPVAWRWKVHGIWHYAGGFLGGGAEPLYAIPAPPQPWRGLLEQLHGFLTVEKLSPAIHSFEIEKRNAHRDHLISQLVEVLTIPALDGEPK